MHAGFSDKINRLFDANSTSEMASNTHAADRHELLTTTLAEATDACWIVDPTPETIKAAVDVVSDGDTAAQLRLLAAEDTLKTAFKEFLVASRTADLVADNDLAVRTRGGDTTNSLVVTDHGVTAVVAAGEQVAGLRADEPDFVETTQAAVADRWADAEAFRLRTPAISEIRATLSDDIGGGIREDFDVVLDSLKTAGGDSALDEVTISLLIAARNEVLLYDISKWGEDVGIASKATFSRTKSRLEDANVITTEKVPIDVGRPRLRLQLGDDRLRTAQTADLAAVAAELLG